MSAPKPVTFYEYAACDTCRKAKKWLDARKLPYESVPIVLRPPSLGELETWVTRSKLPPDKWFNTSGQSYRALLARIGKEGFSKLDRREKLQLLSRDGKMIKRPVLVSEDRVLVGFDEEAYGGMAETRQPGEL